MKKSSEVLDFNAEDGEVEQRIPKKKKHPQVKKSDHKHVYKPIIVKGGAEDCFHKKRQYRRIVYRCTTCGKISEERYVPETRQEKKYWDDYIASHPSAQRYGIWPGEIEFLDGLEEQEILPVFDVDPSIDVGWFKLKYL